MRQLKILGQCLGVFLGTLAVLWLLLCLTAMIPNSAIQKNMLRSAENYTRLDAFEFTKPAQLPSVADHYADAILLNVAWNMGEGDPAEASVATSYYDGEELGENAGLYYTVTEGTAPNTDYTRYWHGTAGIIRLMSLVTDAVGIKTVGFVCFCLLITLNILLLGRKKHWDIAVILLLSLALVRVWNIRLSMEYQPCFLLFAALLPLYLHLERKGDRPILLLCVLSGVATAFFDFLTTETVTILLPVMVVTAVRAKEGRSITLKGILFCGIAWAVSYAGAFLAKWTLASLITGENAFALALTSVGERFGGEVENFAEQPQSFLSALLANLTLLFGGPRRVDGMRLILGLGISLGVLFSLWYLLRKAKPRKGAAVLLLLPCTALILRYLLLNNHSYLHCFFTHRALVSVIFAVFMALWLNIELPNRKKPQKRRKTI